MVANRYWRAGVDVVRITAGYVQEVKVMDRPLSIGSYDSEAPDAAARINLADLVLAAQLMAALPLSTYRRQRQ